MRPDPTADRLLRLCGLLSVIALGMIVITMQHDIPDTTVNALIDGVRFVLAVGVTIGGFIMVIERRVQGAGADGTVMDLREIDLRDDALGSLHAGSHLD